ncbi:MAG: VWA domain-containing protein [Bacteroidetes bacterium]|nr:VWA domain-containing protein [Bacteroidota bacterium]
MKTIKNILLLLAIAISGSVRAQVPPGSGLNPGHNIIQLALLLDVSGSMDGLINQAKTELWAVANEAAKASKKQFPARLEIALYEYGRSTNDVRAGYVKQLVGFTTDLDTLSKVLFALNTNGGDEYCGQVIAKSLEELQWRKSDSVFKVIFIAGNEEFTQGTVSYASSCSNAKEKGVLVNTIHCGDSMGGVNGQWHMGAIKGGGRYFYINSNATFADINTPYDSLIGIYNDSLNTTYISYGMRGMEYKTNQAVQDMNSKTMGKKAYLERASAKSKSSAYSNVHWDAVDAYRNDSNYLEKIWTSGVDSSLGVKNKEELKQLISRNEGNRGRFQTEISRLTQLRMEYIRDHTAEISKAKTLGEALAAAIREQAGKRGFEFL